MVNKINELERDLFYLYEDSANIENTINNILEDIKRATNIYNQMEESNDMRAFYLDYIFELIEDLKKATIEREQIFDDIKNLDIEIKVTKKKYNIF